MKKIAALMCAVVITLSLAACNGKPEAPAPSTPVSSVASVSSEAPASLTAPVEPELSQYEKAKQEILEQVDVAYTGLTPAKAPMYFIMKSRVLEYKTSNFEHVDVAYTGLAPAKAPMYFIMKSRVIEYKTSNF